ncbi:MAG: S-adenosylmethionine:tRNA ribosyltransferase-isomerase, partial [Actinobacteria bacterium]|nr:S-adenosylmethionine:tRNA ribosyltransferase-isomerase [Actinomycetota bacterium]
GRIEHRHFTDLPRLLDAGDVLVVNRSTTLPAAVDATTAGGEPAELHLSTALPAGLWTVELRHPPATRPALRSEGRSGPGASAPWLDAPPGTVLRLPDGGRVELLVPATGAGSLTPASGGPVRLWVAAVLLPEPPLAFLARHGRAIRYSHVDRDWPISAYQTVFANEPGSAEMPSAARPFTAELVTRLVSVGVAFAPFVLHAGVSSLESHEPPFAEWFRVDPETAGRVNTARAEGHRVIAVGTTAVRALETVVDVRGRVHPGQGWTEVVVTPDRRISAVDGLITGWHEPEASHLGMLEAVAGRSVLEASYRSALEEGYLWHEFGDSHLILP